MMGPPQNNNSSNSNEDGVGSFNETMNYTTNPVSEAQTEDNRVRLKRQLGLLHGIGYIIGLVVGGGIFMSPRGVLLHTGSVGLSLVFWIIGGVLTLLGAFTYAEIGISMPESGAHYAYLRRLYGPLFAFLFAWSFLLLSRAGANAVKCLMFGRYILKPFFPDCAVPDVAVKLVGTSIACLLTTVNCLSVKASARGQTAMTFISILALLLITFVGIFWMIAGENEHLNNPFDGSTTDIGEWSLALHTTIFSYYGWSALNYVVEELKNPRRNLPLAIVISVVLATVLYVFVNLSYIVVLGPAGVLESEAVATSVAVKTLGPMSWIMPLLISITACSSFNSGTVVGSRVAFASARRGHLPSFLALINVKLLTPITSLVFQCILVTGYIWSVEVYRLMNYAIFSNLFFDGLVVIGFLRKRWKERKVQLLRDRTLNLPIFIPILYSLILTLLLTVSLITKPSESAAGLLLTLATGLPYYLIFIAWKNKPEVFATYGAKFACCVQKLFYSVPQEGKLDD